MNSDEGQVGGMSAEKLAHWSGELFAADAATVRKALRALPDPKMAARARRGGVSPLMAACEAGRWRLVKLLAEHGGAGQAFEHGRTPLMASAARGDAKSVKLLLPHCDPAAATKYGMDALMYAARKGSLPCVELILSALGDGAGLAADWTGWTAMTWAARHGRTDCLGRLARVGDVEAKDNYGRTPAEVARQSGHAQACEEIGRLGRAQERAGVEAAAGPGRGASAKPRL